MGALDAVKIIIRGEFSVGRLLLLLLKYYYNNFIEGKYVCSRDLTQCT